MSQNMVFASLFGKDQKIDDVEDITDNRCAIAMRGSNLSRALKSRSATESSISNFLVNLK